MFNSSEPIVSTVPEWWPIATKACFYFIFALTPVCFLANLASFVTVTSLERSKVVNESTGVFLKSLAVWDLLGGGWDGVVTILRDYGYRVIDVSPFLCKFGIWHSWGSTRAAALALAYTAFDRCISVLWPIYYREKASKRRFGIINSIIYSVAAYVLASPQLFLVSLREGKCTYEPPSQIFDDIFRAYGGFGLLLVIPCGAAIFCTLAVLMKLRDTQGSKNAKATFWMILAATVLSALLMGTVAVVLIYLGSAASSGSDDELTKSRGDLLDSINRTCLVLNNSVNFFIYIGVSRPYRKAFLKLFRTKS